MILFLLGTCTLTSLHMEIYQANLGLVFQLGNAEWQCWLISGLEHATELVHDRDNMQNEINIGNLRLLKNHVQPSFTFFLDHCNTLSSVHIECFCAKTACTLKTWWNFTRNWLLSPGIPGEHLPTTFVVKITWKPCWSFLVMLITFLLKITRKLWWGFLIMFTTFLVNCTSYSC